MLQLITLTAAYRAQLNDLMEEWYASKEPIYPYSIQRLDYRDFDRYLAGFDEDSAGLAGFVPGSTFFCLDTERNRFVGAVNIRHALNDFLLRHGGHIGGGIRPSERRKGYNRQMIGLALAECRALGLGRVLIVCDKFNIGSAKSIVYNGGVLETEEEIDGETEQRYWVTLG